MVFIESRVFTRRLQELAGEKAEETVGTIQNDLLENPSRGRVVRGLGGIRKGRARNPMRGKGKRGGYRYLYLYLEHRSHIHLLFLLDKNEVEDLTTAERTLLRKLAARVREA